MKAEASIIINSSPEKVWSIITDFKNAATLISAIKKIEVLEEPHSGLVGFKWKETRKMWGKEATEVMWITDVREGKSYLTRAENHGFVYQSGLSISEENGTTHLTQFFEGQAVSYGAKLMNFLSGWMIKGSLKKTLEKDLEDIKRVAEKK